ncbi:MULTISPECIES: hypothetical protein [Sphingomonas]|jgi:hypothetical protein|uniref:Uncharacterized protein n=1 Tax=Sphingomonas hankookensis TaxID=563996 RepID=A0ABR5YEJ8_9SPHN|nr:MULTISPECIES: hypothetical protein [Sphingomonas]KZE17077.1 hypothetical protein AVT10_11475 [Sphingomonas hankookensis]PZT92267.1 MAG: hypothetical protein DI625_13030 [Sphingomonas sp.]RSV25771.1 hypothetical protein CA237_12135 [Sphingomonas sp. ABOLH]WCP71789.1 hypothetical protein PPZ50_15805 [Sphingomonas hankookensis]
MDRKPWIAAVALALSTIGIAQPAAAYPLRITGQTRATQQLQLDVLRAIAEYSSRTGGCRMMTSAHMTIMPRTYVPRQPTRPAPSMGGHYEVWTVSICAAKQRFQVAMWPARQGGADYAITPLTGRMSLLAK